MPINNAACFSWTGFLHAIAATVARHLATKPSNINATLSILVGLFLAAPVLAYENTLVDTHQSSAALNFTIIIPSVLRIVENSHPSSLVFGSGTGSLISASQKIVFVSTLRSGFCMDLNLTQMAINEWKLRVSGNASVFVESSGSGYRLCSRRAGRYALTLEHDFRLTKSESVIGQANIALGWPVNVSMTSP